MKNLKNIDPVELWVTSFWLYKTELPEKCQLCYFDITTTIYCDTRIGHSLAVKNSRDILLHIFYEIEIRKKNHKQGSQTSTRMGNFLSNSLCRVHKISCYMERQQRRNNMESPTLPHTYFGDTRLYTQTLIYNNNNSEDLPARTLLADRFYSRSNCSDISIYRYLGSRDLLK